MARKGEDEAESVKRKTNPKTSKCFSSDIPKPECTEKNCKNLKCCEGYKCQLNKNGKPKCKKLKKTYQLLKEIDIDNENTMSMSNTGNTILSHNDGAGKIMSCVFEDDRVEASSTAIESCGFYPGWTNTVSGDGEVVVLADFGNSVKTYRRGTKKFDQKWYQFGQDIQSDKHNFGTSVASSKNGDILVVGADECCQSDDPELGYVQRYEFQYDSENKDYLGEWQAVGEGIIGEYTDDEIGRLAIGISADGNRIAVGGGTNGFVSVYDWDEGVKAWNKIQRLSFDCKGWADCVCDLTCIQCEVESDPNFGEDHLWLSPDGNILAIGEADYHPDRIPSNYTYTSKGAIHFYEWEGGQFVKSVESVVGQYEYSYIGYSFDLTEDGKTLVVVTSCDVQIMEKDETRNQYVTIQTIVADIDGYTKAVTISDDGNSVAIMDVYGSSTLQLYTTPMLSPIPSLAPSIFGDEENCRNVISNVLKSMWN